MDSNTAPTSDSYPTYGTKSKLQIKSVISIINHSFNVDIMGNTFTSNSGTKGIIYLDTNHRSTNRRVLFGGNTFTQNSGYLDGTTVYIRARG